MTKRRKKVREDTFVGKQARDYAGNSTIHGLTYIAERERPAIER